MEVVCDLITSNYHISFNQVSMVQYSPRFKNGWLMFLHPLQLR